MMHTKKCGRGVAPLPHSKRAERETDSLTKFQLEILLAEIEDHRRGFAIVVVDGLEMLLALSFVLGPNESYRFTGLDALADVEEAVGLAIFRSEKLLDRVLRIVVNLERVIRIGAAREIRDGGEEQQGAGERGGSFDLKLHLLSPVWFVFDSTRR